MRCTRAVELLPLYLRADLDARRAANLSAHLEACGGCRRQAGEFEEARQLMRLYEPPEFSQQLYADIRRQVLREIAATPSTPWLLQLFTPLYRQGAFAAAALMLLVVAAGFVLSSYVGVAPRDTTREQAGLRIETTAEMASGAPGGVNEDALAPKGESGRAVTLARPTRRRSRAVIRSKAPRSVPSRVVETEAAEGVGVTSEPVTVASVEPVEEVSFDLAKTNLPTYVSSDPPQTVRVELQTNDPKVSIIWFTSQRTRGR